MQKKDFLWNLLAIAMVGLLSISFISCGDDDEPVSQPQKEQPNNTNDPNKPDDSNDSNNPSTTIDASLLIGTWKTTFTENDYEIIEFYTDKTYKSYGVGGGRRFEEVGTWTLKPSTNVLTMTNEYSTQSSEILSLTNTKLEVFNSVYERIESSGDDSQGEDSSGSNNQGNGNRGPVATSFKGSGTKNEPYIISNASELRKLSDDSANGETYSGKYFKMTADIKINSKVLMPNGELTDDSLKLEKWIPIKEFAGYYDGQGHTVSGIYINTDADYCGLFGTAIGATIENLVIDDTYIKANCAIGSITGLMTDEGHINRCVCRNSCVIMGSGSGLNIGGIAGGVQSSSSVLNCANYARVEAEGSGCGGIVGYFGAYRTTASIVNCVNKGDVVGSSRGSGRSGGGILGIYMGDRRTPQVIQNCVNTGKILNGGAIIGRLENVLTIVDNYYLNGSAEKWIGSYEYAHYSNSTKKNNTGKSVEEMKSQAFLDVLNENAKSHSDYSLWKFGKDGYPTLDFITE